MMDAAFSVETLVKICDSFYCYNLYDDSMHFYRFGTLNVVLYVYLRLTSIGNFMRLFANKTEMGRTCGTYGGEETCIQGFSGET